MFKRRTCKTCIHYRDIPEWESEEKSNDFTGHCTLNPPEFVIKDEEKPADSEVYPDTAVVKTPFDTKETLYSLFRLTRETDLLRSTYNPI